MFIPDTPAMTFCISTQVGCAMDCGFCLTGRMGFVRNLTAGEIAGQVRVLAARPDLLDKRFNIVLMGMGEPLHNYDDDDEGAADARRRARAGGAAAARSRSRRSACVPALERLAHEPIMPNLAISLHATTDEQRDASCRSTEVRLEELLDACRRFPLKRRSRITFEYVLLDGVNDTPDDARRLVRLLSQREGKGEPDPAQRGAWHPVRASVRRAVNRFAPILAEHGMTVSVRKSRGRDIRAACGQLIVEGQRRAPAQRIAALMRGTRQADRVRSRVRFRIVGFGFEHELQRRTRHSHGHELGAHDLTDSPMSASRHNRTVTQTLRGCGSVSTHRIPFNVTAALPSWIVNALCGPGICVSGNAADSRAPTSRTRRLRSRMSVPWTFGSMRDASVPGRSEYGNTCSCVSGDVSR